MTRIRLALAIATAVAAAIALAPTASAGAPAAQAPTRDWAPISGSIGWQACEPVTWSIDPASLDPRTARAQVATIAWAFAEWSRVSGLRFAYAGEVATEYVSASADLRPVDGVDRGRHIYLAWLTPATAPMLGERTSGFAAPSRVSAGTILGGRGVFSSAYVSASRQAPRKLRALYLHELGHILGLGHASTRANRMYPIVDAATRLGPGDISGVQALTRSCPT